MCVLLKKVIMKEDIHKHQDYKFIQNNIGDDDEISSVTTEIPSDSWLDEKDIMFSTPDQQFQENEPDKDVSFSFLYSKEIDESKEINEDIDLYSDLAQMEEEERRAKHIHEIEFKTCKKELESCKKELEKLKASYTKKIDELSRENENLQKSLCSLTKTAQREIEHKDVLLAEANSKLSNALFRKNFRQNRCDKCQNSSHQDNKNDNSHKRKRSRSPRSSSDKKEQEPKTSNNKKIYEPSTSYNNKEYESSISHNKKKHESSTSHNKQEYESIPSISNNNSGCEPRSSNNKNKFGPSASIIKKEHEPSRSIIKKEHESNTSKTDNESVLCTKKASQHKNNSKLNVNNAEEQQKSNNQCVLFQSLQSDNLPDSSRDLTETNNLFFSLLPKSLKKSFYEYEQSQIISLNRLKQSLINEYFNSDSVVESPTPKSTPEQQGVHMKQLLLNKSSQLAHSVNSTEMLTRFSDSCNSTVMERYEKSISKSGSEEDCVQNCPPKVIKNFPVTESHQKDLIMLFTYRREKVPFLEKRKYGLLEDNKKQIPKCSL